MIYALLRAIAGIALRWYYRGIEVRGLARIPRHAPVLFVVNHPNQLVDALVVGWVVPRRIHITAKSTLFTNPLVGGFLSWIGVIPLRRASDVRALKEAADPSRNEDAFDAIRGALRRRAAVLIFPEGISHDEPSLAPLRTGAARIALDARDNGISDLVIVPIGLTFEKKEAPRSRVFAQVGEPLVMGAWVAATEKHAVTELTAEITARLRSVTFNYESLDAAAAASALAGTVTRLLMLKDTSLGSYGPSLADEATVAHRIEALRTQIAGGDPALQAWGARIAESVTRLRTELRRRGIRFGDVAISTAIGAMIRFSVREAWVLALAGPIALWGEVNHFIPFRAARIIAERSNDSASEPAMRAILSGTLLVLIVYLAQGLVVGFLAGPLWAMAYLVSLPLSADINFRLRDRLRRAARRGHAYATFRRRPNIQARLQSEIAELRAQALAFDAAARERYVTSLR